jgi:4-hydroxyacetophenone monooxygenase
MAVDDELRAGIDAANVPVLLMVLTQLTGDLKWISPPFLPTRTRGMSENQDGGLPAALVAEVTSQAVTAISAWLEGAPPAIAVPDEQLFVRMMSACMGENVDPAYGPMMAEEMGFVERFADWMRLPHGAAASEMRVAIIGAGVSGLAAAALLQRRGISYTVFEKDQQVGGTWFENRYPGCGVDTPSYLYSLSFACQTWPAYFAEQRDVEHYLASFSRRENLTPNIRLSTTVTAAVYGAEDRKWQVTSSGDDGETTEFFSAVISAVGQLNRPKFPSLSGMADFRGRSFHSAQWPDDVDVSGKRVAVVGTGASAMQLVPAVAESAAQVTVFQRSPQWIAPNENYKREVAPAVRRLMRDVPLYAAWYRMRLAWIFGDKIYPTLQVDPGWPQDGKAINALNGAHRRFFEGYIRSELDDRPDLLEKCVPGYPPYSKRMLLDAGWYRTLKAPNVRLVCEEIKGITPAGIEDCAGETHEADVIVYATGFQTLNSLAEIDIVGRDGRRLNDEWGTDNARAYLGVTVPEFPNLFILYGPNTNLGHGGSLIFLTECGLRYTLHLLGLMASAGVSAIECRRDTFEAYNALVDERHAEMIWTQPGVTNWYRNSSGRVVTNSPFRLLEYWEMTRVPNLDDFLVSRRGDRLEAEVRGGNRG